MTSGKHSRREVTIGNVPLAAVLWSGGISFGGVIAFIFADLIILPIISAYRKYYGWSFALRITALMFVTMATAALVIHALFSAAGLVPTYRPTRDQIFGQVAHDYKLVLNMLGFAVFAGLFALTMRLGATDPRLPYDRQSVKGPHPGLRGAHLLLLL